MTAITWWDFSDRGAWQGAQAGLLRSNMSRKPAYDRLYHLVRERWWTHAVGMTEASGEARFRPFLGEHRIKVTTKAGERESALTLEKNGTTRLTVRVP